MFDLTHYQITLLQTTLQIIVGKGEIAQIEQIILVPQWFNKLIKSCYCCSAILLICAKCIEHGFIIIIVVCNIKFQTLSSQHNYVFTKFALKFGNTCITFGYNYCQCIFFGIDWCMLSKAEY